MSSLTPNAVVDGSKPVTVVQVDDEHRYDFTDNIWKPARPGIYLVQCPAGCQHFVHHDRITLLPEGDTA